MVRHVHECMYRLSFITTKDRGGGIYNCLTINYFPKYLLQDECNVKKK